MRVKAGEARGAGERVSVLIVTHNGADDLPDCLRAVVAQDYRPLELVIVDCHSADSSVALARELNTGDVPKRVRPLGRNLGFSGGMNAALELTEAPYVLALNADARPKPDFVSRLVDGLAARPRVAAITGRLVRPTAGADPPLLDACGMRLTRTWRHLDRGSGEPDRGQLGRTERVFGATGAATLYRRLALDDVALRLDGKVEYFDSLFHSYREDAELCFRFCEREWDVVYEPSAVAEHRRRVVPRGRRSLPPMINFHSLKNRYLLRAYHQTWRNALATAPATLARDLMAWIYVLFFERSSLAVVGRLWRLRRQILRRRRWIQARRTAPECRLDRWFRSDSLPVDAPSRGPGPSTLSVSEP